MTNLVYVTLLVASVLLANVNGFTVQGPCPDDENGRPYQPGDRWLAGRCYWCECYSSGESYGCNQRLPTCSYPEGCVKVYDDNGCELMAVMENQADAVCDPISCWIVGK
ncbi:uncharacterized protein LOC144918655 isoform X1 [Branchiostoma floridae x Branchiostoma belcheri]